MRSSLLRTPLRLLGLAAIFCGACNMLTGASELVSGEGDDASMQGSATDAMSDRSLVEGAQDGASLPPEETDADPPREEIPDSAVDTWRPPIGRSLDGGYLRVFLTSSATPGNMGGAAQGDALCNAAALGGGLGGTWRGWLATSTASAASRVSGNGPWVLVDGTSVATSRTQLLGGSLATRIERTEKNTKLTGHIHVWTGAAADGGALPDTCANWAGTGSGEVGYNGTGQNWTVHLSSSCTAQNRLYCFEQ